jgi:nucleotide-binding universal stress UspA family protein
MKILMVVDYSAYSERAIAKLVQQTLPPNSTISLLIAVSPNIPPPAVTVCEGRASLRWQICAKAAHRLDYLEKLLRFKDRRVETFIVETRLPETLALLIESTKRDADCLIAGVHSLLGIRRRLLETAYRIIHAKRPEPPTINPHCSSSGNRVWHYQKAA